METTFGTANDEFHANVWDSIDAIRDRIRPWLVQCNKTSADILRAMSDTDFLPIKRFLASNTNTPEDTLLKLAVLEDDETLYLLARNPNSSPNVLLRILVCEEYIDDPSRCHWEYNSYVPRMIGMRNVSDMVKVALACNPNAPSALIKLIDRIPNWATQVALLGHRAPQRHILTSLADPQTGETIEPNVAVETAISISPYIRPNHLRTLMGWMNEDKGRDAQAIGWNSSMWDTEPGALSSAADAGQHISIAKLGTAEAVGHPFLHEQSFINVYHSTTGPIDEIVLNPAVPYDALESFLGKSTAQLVEIARSKDTPPDVLALLYDCTELSICLAAAANPNLPRRVFEDWLSTRLREVNVRMPLEAVGSSENDDICYDDAEHPWEAHDDWAKYGQAFDIAYWDDAAMDAYSYEIAQMKSADAEASDAAMIAELEAKERSEEELRLKEHRDWLIELAFSINAGAPDTVLAYLADSNDLYIRFMVATNPSTPSDILEQLADEEECLAGVVMNQNVPYGLLKKLLEVACMASSYEDSEQELYSQKKESRVDGIQPASHPIEHAFPTGDEEIPF